MTGRQQSNLIPPADTTLRGHRLCSRRHVLAYGHLVPGASQGTLPLPLVALILGRDVLLIAGSFAVRARALGWRWPGAKEFFRLGGTGQAQV